MPRRRRPRLGTLPLSLALAAGIGTLVLLAVVAVLAIGWTASTRNTLDLLTDKAELTVALAESRLRDHLDAAVDQAAFLADRVERGALDVTDRAQLTTMLTGAMAAAPQIVGLAFVAPSLDMTAIVRLPDGPGLVEADQSGNPAIRAAWAETERRVEPAWGDLVFVNDEQMAALGLRQPLRIDGRLVGMLLATVSVRELSRLLVTFETFVPGQQVFVLYGQDRVLAHRRLIERVPGLSAERPLPRLDEVDDPLLVLLATSREEVPLPSEAVRGYTVALGDWTYVVLLREIAGYGPAPLLLGTAARVEAVNQEIRRLALSGLAGLAVLVAAVVAGIVLGRTIARPIRRAAEQASRVSQLDFARVEDLPGSRFTELDEQGRAFNAMLAGLRWLETYVPRSLVRRLIAQEGPPDVPSVERELTIMFSDIAGFTAAAEHLPSAEIAAFLNRHFAMLAACIEAEGGTIDKFIGDAIMAFWGAPDLQADHAERAARAALAMADAIVAEDAEPAADQLPVRLRVGIHTGLVVVGNIGAPGRMNYTIVGDAVNIASRLEELGKALEAGSATPVVVLISGVTAGRLGPDFAPVSLGPQTLRGRSEPIEVFRLR